MERSNRGRESERGGRGRDDESSTSRGRDDDRSSGRGERSARGRDDAPDRGSRGGRDSEPDRSSRGTERSEGRGSSRSEGRGGGRSSGRSSYTYEKRSAEDVNKRANQGGKDFDSYISDVVKTYKVADGANTIRIMPPTWEAPKHYGIDIWVHYGVGPDQQSYLCLHKMKGEPCPICEELTRARADQESEEYIKSLEPTKRVLFYLVDRDNERDGVQAWAAPWTIDRDVTKISVDRKTNEVLPIDDPVDGFDVEFDKTGKGVGTKYVGLSISRRPSSLGNDDWLDFAVDHPLTSILVYYDYDHVSKAFGGGGSHRDSGGRSDRGNDRNDRDDGRSSRGGGRDDDRSSRGGRGDTDTRGGRGADSGGGRADRSERGGRDTPKLTRAGVLGLTGDALDALIEEQRLDLDPNKFDSDEELAEAICEELRLTEDDKDSRMADMRSRRGRG